MGPIHGSRVTEWDRKELMRQSATKYIVCKNTCWVLLQALQQIAVQRAQRGNCAAYHSSHVIGYCIQGWCWQHPVAFLSRSAARFSTNLVFKPTFHFLVMLLVLNMAANEMLLWICYQSNLVSLFLCCKINRLHTNLSLEVGDKFRREHEGMERHYISAAQFSSDSGNYK